MPRVNVVVTAQVPPPRSSHAAVMCADFMWVFGGMGSRDILGDLWCLDFKTGRWQRVGGPHASDSGGPSARYGSQMVQNPWYVHCWTGAGASLTGASGVGARV